MTSEDGTTWSSDSSAEQGNPNSEQASSNDGAQVWTPPESESGTPVVDSDRPGGTLLYGSANLPRARYGILAAAAVTAVAVLLLSGFEDIIVALGILAGTTILAHIRPPLDINHGYFVIIALFMFLFAVIQLFDISTPLGI